MAKKKATKKRGRKGGDVVRVREGRSRFVLGKGYVTDWVWERYSANHEYIAGSWPETFKRRIDCIASAKRAMTVCPIEVEK